MSAAQISHAIDEEYDDQACVEPLANLSWQYFDLRPIESTLQKPSEVNLRYAARHNLQNESSTQKSSNQPQIRTNHPPIGYDDV